MRGLVDEAGRGKTGVKCFVMPELTNAADTDLRGVLCGAISMTDFDLVGVVFAVDSFILRDVLGGLWRNSWLSLKESPWGGSWSTLWRSLWRNLWLSLKESPWRGLWLSLWGHS